MTFSNYLFRIKQKWKYHTATNAFEKQVAEINRNHLLIQVYPQTFKVDGCELVFDKDKHSFILNQLELFFLLLQNGTCVMEGDTLLYTHKGIRLNLTTAEEIFIIHEVFLEGCYSFSAQGNYSVVDVGMNVGFASLFFAKSDQVNAVYSFEPFKATYNQAMKNLSRNPNLAKKIRPFNVGLGEKNEELTTGYSYENKGQVGILGTTLIKNKIAVEETSTISLREASGIIRDVAAKHVNERFILKLDCEGAEYGILRNLSSENQLDLFDVILIEWHERGPEELVQILSKNDFTSFYQQSSRKRVGMIYASR